MKWLEVAKWLIGVMPSPQPSPADAGEGGFREAVGVSIDADEDQWRPITGDANRDLSPITQRRMRKMALWLWESNLLANRLIELPLAYLLAEGVRLHVEDEDNQRVLDRFWSDPINEMDIKLPQKVRELALYGEQCYPTFVNEHNGHVRLGYLDPDQIETVVTDPDNRSQVIGVVTVKDKRGVARRYRTIINGPEDVFTERTRAIRASFTDGEAFYFTVNDLSNGRRGRSDLLAQADWLDGYDQFLFGELERASFMRAFLWDVTLTGATPEEIARRAKEIFAPKPGSVRVHNDAEKWDAVAPDLKAHDAGENARLFRNHILGGGTIPEHWYGGGGDVNRAVGAEMGEPTFKMFSMRQRFIKHMLESIGRYVLRRAALAAGEAEPDFAEERFQVEAVFPEMTARDTTKYAGALQQVIIAGATAIERGLLAEKTAVRLSAAVAGRLGVEIDVEAELAEARKEASRRAEQDVFTEPPVSGAEEPAAVPGQPTE